MRIRRLFVWMLDNWWDPSHGGGWIAVFDFGSACAD
jgi:hypothetical protein